MKDAINKALKLFNILRDSLFVRALLKGTAAGTEHGKFLQSLDCRHVVDIGANCGQFALISRKCFPDARGIRGSGLGLKPFSTSFDGVRLS